MQIGIIGFGQLGQFMSKHLKDHFDVFVNDVIDRSKNANDIGVKFDTIQECASKDIVILAVPINKFKDTVLTIKDIVKPGSLILDVCSVKEMPAKTMLDNLPQDVEIIATHPMFGPQSGANGIKGLSIVLCPIRTKRLDEVKEFLENKLGLKTIITTPEEHDIQAAKNGHLSHFIGRALVDLDIQQEMITEPAFLKLLELKKMLEEDSLELFLDIQKNNPYAKEEREKFMKGIADLNKQISS